MKRDWMCWLLLILIILALGGLFMIVLWGAW